MGTTPHKDNADGQPSAAPTARWLLVGCLLAGLAWSSWSWFGQLPIAASPADYLSPKHQQRIKSLMAVTQDFGFNNSIIIGLSPRDTSKEDVFSGRMLGLNRTLTARLQPLSGVASVLSIASSQSISKEGGALVVRPMFPAKAKHITTTIQRRLRKQVMGDPLLRGSLVSEDASLTLVLVQLKSQKAKAAAKTIASIRKHIKHIAHDSNFAQLGLTGQPLIGPIVGAAAAKDGRAFGPIALVFFALMLFIGLAWTQASRALLLMALIILVGTLTCIGLFGGIFAHKAWLALLAWWMAAAWWFQPRRWSREPIKPRGPHDHTPLLAGQRHNLGIAIAAFAGFALLLVPQTLFQRMGWASWTAGIAAIALLSLLFPGEQTAPPQATIVRAGRLPALLWWVVIMVSSLGLFHLKTGGILDAVYPRKSRLALGEQLQRKHFGGAAPLLIRFQGDLRDPIALKSMERVSRRLEVHPAIFGPQSIAGLIRQLNALLNTYPRVPNNERQINALWMFLEGQPALKSLVRRQGKDGILQARIKMPRGWDSQQLTQQLKEMLADVPRRYETVHISKLSPTERKTQLTRRVGWIKEALSLWLMRHAQLSLPQRHNAAGRIDAIVKSFTFAAHAPPPARPLPQLQLQRKLTAYLTSEDCDLELKKPQQKQVLIALLLSNRAGKLQQPKQLKHSLMQGLKGTEAAKDKDSIKYVMKALRHIVKQIYQRHLVAQFQQAIFLAWKHDRGFIQQLSKSLRQTGHVTPKRRMAELQAELMEIFSPTFYRDKSKAKGTANQSLKITISGVPSIMLPLQRDAQTGAWQAAAAIAVVAILLLLLFLAKRLSAARVVGSLLLTWLLCLGTMGFFGIPLNLSTALFLPLIGLLALAISVPVALTPPEHRSYQHLMYLSLWLSIPLTPFFFASLPIVQHATMLLALAPWLAASAAAFVFSHEA